MSKLNKYSQKK